MLDGDHNWLAVVEIRNAGGKQLGTSEARSLQMDLRQDWMLQFSEKRIHLVLHLIHIADVRESPATELRGLTHEVAVGR